MQLAGVKIARMGSVIPRQSECCAIKGAQHDQTTCIHQFRQYLFLDDSSCFGDIFIKCFTLRINLGLIFQFRI